MTRLLSASRVANFNKVQKKLYIKMSMDKEALIDDLNSVWNFGVKKGLSKGLKQGRKQGIQQRNYEIALTALNDGIAPEQVAKITGLSLVAVKKLAEN